MQLFILLKCGFSQLCIITLDKAKEFYLQFDSRGILKAFQNVSVKLFINDIPNLLCILFMAICQDYQHVLFIDFTKNRIFFNCEADRKYCFYANTFWSNPFSRWDSLLEISFNFKNLNLKTLNLKSFDWNMVSDVGKTWKKLRHISPYYLSKLQIPLTSFSFS